MNTMNKIKTLDFDYQEKEKIQKFLKRAYFEQNQRNIRLNLMNQQKNKSYLSIPNNNQKIKIKRNILKKRVFSDNFRNTTFIRNENNLRANSMKNQTINNNVCLIAMVKV